MSKISVISIALFLLLTAKLPAQSSSSFDARADALLAKMTLEEKIGQLNQYSSPQELTGPQEKKNNILADIQAGKVGSMLNVRGVDQTTLYQKAAMESRLHIPLLFGLDVIHGYHTTFPIPLAEASSWDMEAIEAASRVAATEASASGIHWTFAPMVDIARDPRWGRVMEGAGEDPYLGSQIAKARVLGFQGKGLGSTDAVMACVKHFAGYGAAIGGRDYNSVDMSRNTLWNIYLPPFKAALDAGAATFMNAFNTLNGIPATGNKYLLRDILKGQWKFDGFVVSDWGSIGEMTAHGYAEDQADAAKVAIAAGTDMDMESHSYIDHLKALVESGQIKEGLINDAVKRILIKKFQMGLFEDPYRFSDKDREKRAISDPAALVLARSVAAKSIVLLKNEHHLLPLSSHEKTIALIGPLVKTGREMKGAWSIGWGKEEHVVSLYEGMQKQAGHTRLLYAKGCEVNDTSRAGFGEAIEVAKQSDIIVMAVGENAGMSGEARSRSNIHIPGVQEALIKAIQATGKPVVVLLMSGRPLLFNWTADHVPAILCTWFLGSEAGNAIADVLYGKYNPSGKLTMTFPRTEGQIPIYYNYLNTGRPAPDGPLPSFRSGYFDLEKSPRYAFGYGLSYTTFEYRDLQISKKNITAEDSLTVSFTLKNTGARDGAEVAQLYLRDLVAKPVRPVKELKDFKKIFLKAGESQTVIFKIGKDKLSFYDKDLNRVEQPGKFELMIGGASDEIRLRGYFDLH